MLINLFACGHEGAEGVSNLAVVDGRGALLVRFPLQTPATSLPLTLPHPASTPAVGSKRNGPIGSDYPFRVQKGARDSVGHVREHA